MRIELQNLGTSSSEDLFMSHSQILRSFRITFRLMNLPTWCSGGLLKKHRPQPEDGERPLPPVKCYLRPAHSYARTMLFESVQTDLKVPLECLLLQETPKSWNSQHPSGKHGSVAILQNPMPILHISCDWYWQLLCNIFANKNKHLSISRHEYYINALYLFWGANTAERHWWETWTC